MFYGQFEGPGPRKRGPSCNRAVRVGVARLLRADCRTPWGAHTESPEGLKSNLGQPESFRNLGNLKSSLPSFG